MITPRRAAVTVGIALLIGLVAYFRHVRPFSSPLSTEQRGAVAAQEKKIIALEAQNEKAEREVKMAKAAQVLAERREKEAAGRLAQRNQEIAAWATKYAELKSRPAQLVTKAGEAEESLRQMGWTR
jgi:chromosome segregation ATPase